MKTKTLLSIFFTMIIISTSGCLQTTVTTKAEAEQIIQTTAIITKAEQIVLQFGAVFPPEEQIELQIANSYIEKEIWKITAIIIETHIRGQPTRTPALFYVNGRTGKIEGAIIDNLWIPYEDLLDG